MLASTFPNSFLSQRGVWRIPFVGCSASLCCVFSVLGARCLSQTACVVGRNFYWAANGCVSVALQKVWFRRLKPYLLLCETIRFARQEHTFDMLDDGVSLWGGVFGSCRMGFFARWRSVCGFFCGGGMEWKKRCHTAVCRQVWQRSCGVLVLRVVRCCACGGLCPHGGT